MFDFDFLKEIWAHSACCYVQFTSCSLFHFPILMPGAPSLPPPLSAVKKQLREVGNLMSLSLFNSRQCYFSFNKLQFLFLLKLFNIIFLFIIFSVLYFLTIFSVFSFFYNVQCIFYTFQYLFIFNTIQADMIFALG